MTDRNPDTCTHAAFTYGIPVCRLALRPCAFVEERPVAFDYEGFARTIREMRETQKEE